MRGAVDGLLSAHPLGRYLPGLFQTDSTAQAFVAGLDEVLAPVLSVVDNTYAYIDPRYAPVDFLPWLAGWVGLPLSDTWTVAERRQLLVRATDLLGMRGTLVGLRAILQAYVGGDVTVSDSGGSTWSATPGGALPGTGEFRVDVRVVVPAGVSPERVAALVEDAVPVHVHANVEVVTST